jgi:hypothetical protein
VAELNSLLGFSGIGLKLLYWLLGHYTAVNVSIRLYRGGTLGSTSIFFIPTGQCRINAQQRKAAANQNNHW